MWCPKDSESWFKRVYSVFTIIVITIDVMVTIEVAIFLIIGIQSNKFELEVFFIFTSLANGLYKGLNILIARRRIQKLFIRGFEDRWQKARDNSEETIIKDSFYEGW